MVLGILAGLSLALIGGATWWLHRSKEGPATAREKALASALEQTGTQRVTALADLFATNRVRVKLVPPLENLILKLQHPGDGKWFTSDDVQAIAQVRLPELGPEAKTVVPRLIPLLRDPDRVTRH
jgi:hypothetical protein